MSIKRLPDSELEVMQAVWDLGERAPRAEVERIVQQGNDLAQTTILTLLSRLTEKGFIKAEKEGRSSVYTPLISKEDYLADQSRRFFDKLCGGDVKAFAAALSGSGISDDDIAELRQLLERKEL